MRQKSMPEKEPATQVVKNIRRATRRHFSAEDKIRIVLEGLRGEDSIAELCRKEGINQNLYYRWSKEFLEAGKNWLAGDTAREATSDEVKELKAEARQLRETLAEVLIENRLLKKAFSGMGRTLHEVFRIGKVRDHRTGGTVVALDCKCAITWVTPSPPWGGPVQLNSPINVSGLTGTAPQSSGRPVRHVFEPTAYHSLKR